MLEAFSWLHLSDIHFRAAGDTFSQSVLAEEIQNDIPAKLSSSFPLEFAVVTGDIAFSGKPDEYTVASEFFGELSTKLGIDRHRFFFVPGNHDVDRNIRPYLHMGARQSLSNQQAVDRFLGSELEFAELLSRQSAFRSFQSDAASTSTGIWTSDGLARVTQLDLSGFRVCVLEFNSAWISGSGDSQGNLLIGERQVINALALSEPDRPNLMLALAHHPIDWLTDFDRLSCAGRLLPNLDVLHTGHVHRHDFSAVIMPGSECLLVSAGASHATRHFENSYNVIEVDVANALIRVRQIEYQPHAGEFVEVSSKPYQFTFREAHTVSPREIEGQLFAVQPDSKAHIPYMAALLSGDLNEIPVTFPGSVLTFAAQNSCPEFEFETVAGLLRLKNLLKLTEPQHRSDLLANHRPAIAAFAGSVSLAAERSSEFAQMLRDRVAQARQLIDRSQKPTVHFQIQYLEELAAALDWEELAVTSRRYVQSSIPDVVIAAQRHLVWALLQSDDQEQRREGYLLAIQLLELTEVESGDYIAASLAAEIAGESCRASEIALEAITRWPGDPSIREHCRSMATSTGNRELRDALRQSGIDQ